jgi:hypothetical protein
LPKFLGPFYDVSVINLHSKNITYWLGNLLTYGVDLSTAALNTRFKGHSTQEEKQGSNFKEVAEL